MSDLGDQPIETKDDSEVVDDAVVSAYTDQTDVERAVIDIPAKEKKMVKKLVRKKRRPARPQVDPSFITSEPPPQTGTVFNIWYLKWSGGDREDKYLSQTHAKGRCNIALDSGYTVADGVPGSYFCLFFARGLCPKGQECSYLHRLPGVYDLFNPNVDCFGRDKFADYRDDMGGVGSFLRQNRTIYVGRIHVTEDVEEIVARHFAEWGQVERIRVLNTRGVAFITYTNEANSQFAKEAMGLQSLDHNEILNVRWATADPNPMSQAREARRVEDQAAEAVRRALPAAFVAEIEGKDLDARKRRKLESGYGLQGYEAPDEVHFARGPNAVNPAGRSLGLISGRAPSLLMQGDSHEEQAFGRVAAGEEGRGGIFAGHDLGSLLSAGLVVTTARREARSMAYGPLVGYDSGGEDD